MTDERNIHIQYPSRFISMQTNDRLCFLEENYELKDLRHATHWLLKVVAPQHEEGFKIYIFAAMFKGSTQGYERPIFETKKRMSLIQAIEMLDYFENKIKEDVLYQNERLKKNRLFISWLKKKRVVLLPLKRGNQIRTQ